MSPQNNIQITLPPMEPWQQEVFNAMQNASNTSQIYVVKAKRQIGKSILAIIELIYYSFGLYRPTTNVVLEPTLNQSRRLYKQIVKMFEGTKVISKANETLLTIEFINGSEIIFKSAEQRDALRGFTVTGLLVIDEGAYITDDIYEIIFPTTDANKAPMLIISTPLFAEGMFYELYVKGKHYNKQGIFSFDWNKYDTSKFLDATTLERYREALTPNKFKSEYLGEFIVDGSYVFGNIRTAINPDKDYTLPTVGGIDWGAGGGGDSTVITLLSNNGRVTDILDFNNLRPTEQITRIQQFMHQHPTVRTLQVELNSIGSVYYDLLKQALPNVRIIGFDTTNESKCRVIENLINAFEQHNITIPDDSQLILQLQHYELQKLKHGYTYNGAKGFHDDFVISLALGYDLVNPNNNNYTIVFKNKQLNKH